MEVFKSSQLSDIVAYVPGLQIDSQGAPGQTTVSLRGIAPLGSSATISTYIDEAPVGSSSLYARGAVFAADLLPYDIERIEVLKGPQGTLYGASSIGGLLKYVTKTPDLNSFEARAGADVFSIADSGDIGYAGRVGINLPVVTDKIAIRGSYAYQHTPGYIDNVATGAKDVNKFNQQSARLAQLSQASDTFSLKLAGLWQSIDAHNNAVSIATLPAEYLDPADPRSRMQVPPSVATPIGDGRSQAYVLPEFFKKDLYYFTATADLDLGFANLISASSYAHSKTSQRADVTDVYGVVFPLFGFPAGRSSFGIDLDLKKFTQELRLASSGEGAFEWMFGGFYTHEKSGNKQIALAFDNNNAPIAPLNPFAIAQLPTTYSEYAAFGEASYTFADVFELSAGLRWAHNDQKYRQITSGFLFPNPENVPGSSKEDVWT
ncbi:MAG: TonB-dependent receptor, partial [Sphingomonadaceae bacterium]